MPEYTKSDFLGIIREKYPAYSTWDDSLLFAKIMEKYPVYEDQIIQEELPAEPLPSAEEAAIEGEAATEGEAEEMPGIVYDDEKLNDLNQKINQRIDSALPPAIEQMARGEFGTPEQLVSFSAMNKMDLNEIKLSINEIIVQDPSKIDEVQQLRNKVEGESDQVEAAVLENYRLRNQPAFVQEPRTEEEIRKSEDPDVIMDDAQKLMSSGDYKGAEEWYKKALDKKYPNWENKPSNFKRAKQIQEESAYYYARDESVKKEWELKKLAQDKEFQKRSTELMNEYEEKFNSNILSLSEKNPDWSVEKLHDEAERTTKEKMSGFKGFDRIQNDLTLFAQGMIEMPPSDLAEAYFFTTKVEQFLLPLAGFVTEMYALGGVTRGTVFKKTAQALRPGTGGAKVVRKLSDLTKGVVTESRIVGIVSRSSEVASSFGLYETIRQTTTTAPLEEKVAAIITTAGFGLGLGVIGGISQPLVRISTEGAYGYLTSKLRGASDEESLLTGATFIAFGFLSRGNLSRVDRAIAMDRLKSVTNEAFRKKVSQFPVDKAGFIEFGGRRVTPKEANTFYSNVIDLMLKEVSTKLKVDPKTGVAEVNLKNVDDLINKVLKQIKIMEDVPLARKPKPAERLVGADITPVEVVKPVKPPPVKDADVKLVEVVKPKDVHKAAEEVGMEWDDDAAFMALSKRITGKERIDDMTSDQRAELIAEIEAPAVEAPPTEVAVEEFVPAIDKMKETEFGKKDYLTFYSVKNYGEKETKLFLMDDKNSGYGINPDGELISVFSHPSVSGEGRGDLLVSQAVQNGATYLDAVGDHLRVFYERHGFEEVRREKNLTPGEPDVIFMERKIPYEQTEYYKEIQALQKAPRKGAERLRKEAREEVGRREPGLVKERPEEIRVAEPILKVPSKATKFIHGLQKEYKGLVETRDSNIEQLGEPDLLPAKREGLELSLQTAIDKIEDVKIRAKDAGIEIDKPPPETEGIKEVINVLKDLDVDNRQIISYVDELRDIQDEIDDPDVKMTPTTAAVKIEQAGLKGVDPKRVAVAAENYEGIRDGVLKDIINVYRSGDLGAPMHERGEVYYKNEAQRDPDFVDFISSERSKIEEATGEKEPDKPDIEWFADRTEEYSFGAEPATPISSRLRKIFERFREYAKALFEAGKKLSRWIKEGKVSPEMSRHLRKAAFEPIEKVSWREVKEKHFKLKLRDKKIEPILRGLIKDFSGRKQPLVFSVKSSPRTLTARRKRMEAYAHYLLSDSSSPYWDKSFNVKRYRDWWGSLMDQAKDNVSNYVDTGGEIKNDMYNVVLSLTSPINRLEPNFDAANYVTNEFFAEGRFPLFKPVRDPKTKKLINLDPKGNSKGTLNKLQNIVDYFEGDVEQTLNFIYGQMIKEELVEFATRRLGFKRDTVMRHMREAGIGKGDYAFGAYLFGSKVGEMMGALQGYDLEGALDVWMARFESIATGDIKYVKGEDGVIELKGVPVHKESVRQAIRNTKDDLNKNDPRYKDKPLSSLEAQAMIWAGTRELFMQAGQTRYPHHYLEVSKQRRKQYETFTPPNNITDLSEDAKRRAFSRQRVIAKSDREAYETDSYATIPEDVFIYPGKKPRILKEKSYKLRKKDPKHQENIKKSNELEETIDEQYDEKNIKDLMPEIDDAQAELDILYDTEKRSIPVFSKIADVYRNTHDWIWTFGETRRDNPDLFWNLMRSYGRRNAGIEKAINEVEKSLGGVNLSVDDAAEISLAYNDKRKKIKPELEKPYESFKNLLETYEDKVKSDHLYLGDLKQRLLDEINEKIDNYKSSVKNPEGSDKLQHLISLREGIENMRYLPQTVVLQKALEHKYREIPSDKRAKFIKKLGDVSFRYRKRTGLKLLDDYLKDGIITKEDIDIRRLAVEVIDGYYYRSSLKMIYDYSKQQGLLQQSSPKLRELGWISARQMGVKAPEYAGHVIHPVLAGALHEMGIMKKHGRGGLAKQVMGSIKIGQFIKPRIIWIYDVIQKGMGGMYGLSPLHESYDLTRAFNSVFRKTKDYHELNEMNLYQFPYETTIAGKEEQIKMLIRRTSKSVPYLVKKLDKITGMSWELGDLGVKDLLMSPFRLLSNLTWTGDQILRTWSVYSLERMGYPRWEAVKVAGRFHGAYSELSTKYKKTMSPIFFVHSFRVLMPLQVARVFTDPIKEVLHKKGREEQDRTGDKKWKKYKRAKWNRMAKAIAFTIAMPVALDLYMQSRGFEREKAFGFIGWKWSKNITKIDKLGNKHSYELVVAINNIINMPVKWFHRITSRDPLAKNQLARGISNFLRWEVHPLHRLFLWDIKENQRSFGKGATVWDPELDPSDPEDMAKIIAQISKYMFGQSLRFYGQLMDSYDKNILSNKELKEEERLLNEAMSTSDKVLFNLFGYSYIRIGLDQRRNGEI